MRRLLAFSLLLAATPAMAHVSLTEKSAKPGTLLVAHFRVGHGCSGSPTTALPIEMPASASQVRVETKRGWKDRTELAPDGKHVSAVGWQGGSLPSDQAGEFAVSLRLPATEGQLLFPVTQTCAAGTETWNERPQAGAKHPAPALMVGEDAAPGGGMDMKSMPGMDMKASH
jgi:uncharacterized protein YcnI